MSGLRGELRDRLARIRLLVTDVDGVLTDGTLHYGAEGEIAKTFHVRDGMGLRLLRDNGVEVAVVTARESQALASRMSDLGIRHFYPGRDDKWSVLEALLTELGLAADQVAFVGDDVLDLGAMRRVGVAITVRDGHALVREQADWVTEARGGHGAVREIADAILDSRGLLRGVCGAYGAVAEPGGFTVVIPSRYGATRLPGKPLRDLAGRPMIAHVWDCGVESGAAEVLVAVDDDRIRDAVEGFGGRALMTSPDHASGTDRLAEVADQLGWPDDKIVVNLQGDEPCMDPALVRRVAEALAARPEVGIATFAAPITRARDLFDPNVVKVVLDDRGVASWFSRAPIPWVRGLFDSGAGGVTELPDGVRFLRHLGLYAYRVGILRQVSAAPPSPHERAESLEQLRAVALGIDIHVSITDKAPLPGVDTEEDLKRAEQELAGRAPA